MGKMYFSVTTLVFMLLSVPGTFGAVLPEPPFNCTRYYDYVMKEFSCRPRGLLIIFDEGDGVLTGQELLGDIQIRCSNQSAVQAYLSCMNELDAKCPEQFPLIRDALQRKKDTFCDGTEVSAWLSTTLQSGFTYNMECGVASDLLFGDCTTEASAPYSHIGSGVTLSAAVDILTPLLKELFQCTKTSFSQAAATFEECGSSWQDMLLAAWLRTLASSTFGMHIANTEEVQLQEQLQALVLGENGNENLPSI